MFCVRLAALQAQHDDFAYCAYKLRSHILGEAFFWFSSARPFVSRGAKIAFFLFELAIFDQFRSSIIQLRAALPCGFIFFVF